MFGSLGGPEIFLIFLVALLVFGPRRLPEIGRKAGGLLRELRKATGEFRSSIQREIGFDPVTGIEVSRKARRDILTTVSDPIREVAQGAMDATREIRGEVAATFGTIEKPRWEVPRKSQPGAGQAQAAVPGSAEPAWSDQAQASGPGSVEPAWSDRADAPGPGKAEAGESERADAPGADQAQAVGPDRPEAAGPGKRGPATGQSAQAPPAAGAPVPRPDKPDKEDAAE